MAKVKLNLIGLSIPDKVQFAKQVTTALSGNADFPSPMPAISEIEKSIDNLQTAYSEANTTRQLSYTKTAIQTQKEKELDMLLTAIGNYVENICKGDEAKIKSAGLETRAKASAVGVPTVPESLSAAEGVKQGEIKLKWKSVKGSKSYVVRKSIEITDDTKWQQDQVVTKSTASCNGLKSGTQYWFQVAAVGSAGQGPWSDPATKIAP